MTIDLKPLENQTRLLFSIGLKPIQTDRFQPTGFPSLGAATYQAKGDTKILVESAQSMANRLEATCWDTAKNEPVAALKGISHVTVTRGGKFLTDTMLEAHRINSPYTLAGDRAFLDQFLAELRTELGAHVVDNNEGSVDRHGLAKVLLKYDVGSLLHGCFISANDVKLTAESKKGSSVAGGRLRVARALSCFIEATGAKVAPSGGVKNDHVNPSGKTNKGFGNVPFARDEFTADQIQMHVNLDLAQLRGYAVGSEAEELLVLLGLFKVRRLLDGDLRLRSACDLELDDPKSLKATRPEGFHLPEAEELTTALKASIEKCGGMMVHTKTAYEAALDKGSDEDEKDGDGNQEEET